MKPNYKALAEKYRNDTSRLMGEVAQLFDIISTKTQALEEKDRELDEWKTKYVQMLNMYVESLERIARKEEGNG